MRDCGHRCCAIRANAYHAHVDPPGGCDRCARATERDRQMLAEVITSVITRVAPEIPGLPTGADLTELVTGQTVATYARALTEPAVQGLSERERRTVLAGRVGVALAALAGAGRPGDPPPRRPVIPP